MILALSVRFKRYIALFLFGVFYSQLLLAAGQLRAAREVPVHPLPGVARYVIPSNFHGHTSYPDSTIIPRRSPGMPDLTASASFRTPVKAGSDRKMFIGGPTQPEMESFKSASANDMVDLFTGDFSYNIPLMDVGGYPVNISYHSGRSMDEEASWVGLGWNINPGSITREMRGLPDDFSGGNDTIKKVSSIKPNISWGVNYAAGIELSGLPVGLNLGAGIFHTTYNGWGVETSLNASINAGSKSSGTLSGGLSLTNNSQNGLTLSPSLSYQYDYHTTTDNGSASLGVQFAAPYNSRTGLKDIQMNVTSSAGRKVDYTRDGHPQSYFSGISSSPVGISFSWPSYTPTMTMPMTNFNFSFTAKLGGEAYVLHPNEYLSGYYGKEYVAAQDTVLLLPAFGYLNFQNRGNSWTALTDFNREKEMPYRENPPVPHIAIPSYTYDVFSMSGEGNSGMFRAYRSDIGFIADHQISSKTTTGAASVDFGGGNMLHAGVDLNANYSTTQSGPWLADNPLMKIVNFQQDNGLFEAAYFRNPAEKTINTTDFYDAIGGDNVATVALSQNGSSIRTTNVLNLYDGEKLVGTDTLTNNKAIKKGRDKRSQVISYLTATEAAVAGLDKNINRYAVNQFGHTCENDAVSDTAGMGTGLMGYYFTNQALQGEPAKTPGEQTVFYNWQNSSPFFYSSNTGTNTTDRNFPSAHWSARWLGRLKAPASGTYTFGFWVDDGLRFWVNDSLLINDWKIHGNTWDTCRLNLVAGKMYNIRIEYYNNAGGDFLEWSWYRPDITHTTKYDHNHFDPISLQYLFQPVFSDTVAVNPYLTEESRVNSFRKPNHLSEIDVLNPDGRRYVYGIPVYNLDQKEVSFSINSNNANVQTGLTAYSQQDNSTQNTEGKDGYYSRQEIPAYAHSFLLTGIVSPDYVDVTGDGISDDDIGDAIRFDYSRTAGLANPYGWRSPYVTDSVSYSQGFRSYNRDDKGNYIYGTKELWYLHTIESKTMIATFTLQSRADLLEIDENGNKVNNGKAMCLKQIDLYSKADFVKNGTAAIPVKTVHFVYDYALCRGVSNGLNNSGTDSGKLTLKEIWFTYNGNNKGVLNPYVFSYHPNNPRYKLNSSDKWGTYKDASQNPGATPSNPMTNAEYPYALQDSVTADNNAGAWALDSIQLPAGGRIKVNYESDDYAYVQNRRATQLCTIAGIGTNSSGTGYSNRLYNFFGGDGLYVYINVPYAPSSKADLYARYLDGISKLYFRLCVTMPKDDFGGGSEYIPCYADPDTAQANWYGTVSSNPNIIWVKIKGVNKSGDGDGSLNPLAQTAINFLRLNLPDKAYPGSEVNDNLNFTDGIKVLLSQVTNITEMLSGFTNTARQNGWASVIDPTRSFARLDCPGFKKRGGGSRVHSILIYDNWNAMTNQKETVYGQVYSYTTTQNINGVPSTISSGVASWEPSIGCEENPFHLPIEYTQKTSIIGPAALQYSEEPLGESFYPGPSIGYSKVRVRSIHTKGTRSANGYGETTFYTTYDFPVSWDYSQLDNNTKKRYKPILNNFLRINVQNFLTLSQGFKVELNDMNGKVRSEASYSETDSVNPISYTENFYKVDNGAVPFKHLNNTVATIDPSGNINLNSTIGKDAELMTDMRDQTTNMVGANINLNTDMFAAGPLPVIIPSILNLYQHETDQFRSVSLTKVVQRYGILDSIVHIDKGSKVSTKNLLYDAETGQPLLTRTQNEFNDSLFDFTYPSHWAYPGTGPAYWNIDARFKHLTIEKGQIVAGLAAPDSTYLSAGDEVLIASKRTISVFRCDSSLYGTFADSSRLWVVDSNLVHGGPKKLFLMDVYGIPFSGNDVSLKVVRSGHRNQGSPIGMITSLADPMVADGSGVYHLVFDSTRKVINASANELQQFWRVSDKRRSDQFTACVYTTQDSALAAGESCTCLKPFFDHLIASHQLYPTLFNRKTVGALAAEAGINLSSCPILNNSANTFYRVLNPNPNGAVYTAIIGGDYFNLHSVSGLPMDLSSMTASTCNGQGQVLYKNPNLIVPKPDTVTVNIYPVSAVNLLSALGNSCPNFIDTLLQADSVSDHLLVENSLTISGSERNAVGILNFGRLEQQLPVNPNILSAQLTLTADQRGHYGAIWPNANSTQAADTVGLSLAGPTGWQPGQALDTMLYQAYYTPYFRNWGNATGFQSISMNVLDYLNGYLNGTYNSSNFVLTQGTGNMHSNHFDSNLVNMNAVPPYLEGGYGNYYATYYNQRYSDHSKWPVLQITYVQQPVIDTLGAILEYNSSLACTSIPGRTCYSAVTDTLVNPYQYALLGDYRPATAYLYYGRRVENDPYQPTNIRTNGVISGFAPFWNLRNGAWAPGYDSSRWAWKIKTTLYSRKGFELENKDPLGRYNSAVYGYDLTLPIAITQDSRYQESAFEGFEDYGFSSSTCDTSCPEKRPFDFSAYSANISDSAAHTGLYSLRIPAGGSVVLSGLNIASAADPDNPQLSDTLTTDSCGTHFGGIKAGPYSVLPSFKPFAGKQMLIGAWVKEKDSCSCQAYSQDHIVLGIATTGRTMIVILQPSGNIIEGWQRYEAIVSIPDNANALTMTLQAASSTTYFDDIRIHPFNAEMKSYIYNSTNLRLMAELDENNYATFYEYDDDGTLIRVKKETERGIQTIKETRSALLKNQ